MPLPNGLIKWYQSPLDMALRSPGGPVGRYCNGVAHAIMVECQVNAVQRVKARSGRYAKIASGGAAAGFNIVVTRTPYPEGCRFTVVNRTRGTDPTRKGSYAAVLEYGSKPHIIRPRNSSGYLVFNVGGHKVVTKQVNHPGTKPYWIMRDAMTRVASRVGWH